MLVSRYDGSATLSIRLGDGNKSRLGYMYGSTDPGRHFLQMRLHSWHDDSLSEKEIHAVNVWYMAHELGELTSANYCYCFLSANLESRGCHGLPA